jgi:hypothetical protein
MLQIYNAAATLKTGTTPFAPAEKKEKKQCSQQTIFKRF